KSPDLNPQGMHLYPDTVLSFRGFHIRRMPSLHSRGRQRKDLRVLLRGAERRNGDLYQRRQDQEIQKTDRGAASSGALQKLYHLREERRVRAPGTCTPFWSERYPF